MDTLDRRATYLEARAAIRAFENKPASFDDAEVAALRWAIKTIKEAANAGKIEDSAAPDIGEIELQSRIDAGEVKQ